MNKTETKYCKSTYLINCCGGFCWQHSQRYTSSTKSFAFNTLLK